MVVCVESVLYLLTYLNNILLKEFYFKYMANNDLFQGPVKETSVFTLNMNYSNKRTKFKITQSVQKETPQVRKCAIFYS